MSASSSAVHADSALERARLWPPSSARFSRSLAICGSYRFWSLSCSARHSAKSRANTPGGSKPCSTCRTFSINPGGARVFRQGHRDRAADNRPRRPRGSDGRRSAVRQDPRRRRAVVRLDSQPASGLPQRNPPGWCHRRRRNCSYAVAATPTRQHRHRRPQTGCRWLSPVARGGAIEGVGPSPATQSLSPSPLATWPTGAASLTGSGSASSRSSKGFRSTSASTNGA